MVCPEPTRECISQILDETGLQEIGAIVNREPRIISRTEEIDDNRLRHPQAGAPGTSRKAPVGQRMMRVREAARYLGVSPWKVRQLISAIAPNERERTARISSQIRALATDMGIPIVAVSQLNRPKDKTANERPNKFRMKESGSLENDANAVQLIYRPMDNFGHPTGDDEIVIAKQRNGPVGNEAVRFDGRTMTFFETTTKA